ncbi:MAG: glutamate formimidoyltransferase [Bacillota bacterium]|jgi:glutamate formiminotransferase
MRQGIVECVPNFSEGRNPEVIDRIVQSISDAGCKVLDVSSDQSHNRSVVTFAGFPEKVEEAAFRATSVAADLIDMEKHKGEHPRIGATDVIPFVPIRDITIEECVCMAERVGKRIGEELGIPVYLYAKAAKSEDRIKLPNMRKGEYEGLKEAIQADPSRKPDFGPDHLHPRAGATAVGARPPLLAYNVNLNTGNVKVARAIAKAIRESSGGLPSVQAKGILIEETGLAQVTMNLLDYKTTSIDRVLRQIEEEAAARGTSIRDSEIIGLVPLDAILDVAISRMKADSFSRRQILDLIDFDRE